MGGTFPQRIFSCLMTLDKLLCHRNTAVVASYLVAEKKSTSTIYQKDVVKTVFNILGKRFSVYIVNTTLQKNITAVEY